MSGFNGLEKLGAGTFIGPSPRQISTHEDWRGFARKGSIVRWPRVKVSDRA